MIHLKESITVQRPLKQVFNYTSDFSRIREWDPGVQSSSRRHPGKTGVGSTYDLVLKFGPFRPEMAYETTVYEPFSRVVLTGVGGSFTAVDTIEFTSTDGGTRIDYQADIRFHRLGSAAEQMLLPIMKKTGKAAMAGLKRKLSHTPERPVKAMRFASGSNLLDYIADHLILPGMLMFSAFGHDLSRRFWVEPGGTLCGKKVVLTGGTSGIGKAAALMLAEKKACLTIIARNPEKAEQVQQELIEKTGNPHIDFLTADLSLMKDIDAVATALKASKSAIDVLINNAGALFNDRQQTPEGLEQTFATDLLGVFHLTMSLKEALARSGSSRVINVSSGGMYTQKIEVNDLQNRQEPYNGARAYARAKRGIVILTRIWAEQFRRYGIRVHAMHPGWVDTPGIKRALPVFHQRMNRLLRTPQQGADTVVWLAASKRAGEHTGLFWLDRRPHETVLFPGTGESGQERQQLWDRLNQFISKR